MDLNSRNQLDLDPPYQRRSVWTRKDREYFIDTIFNNYPSPAVFLHRTFDDHGNATYHVVDGKQRIQSILMFANNKLRIPETFGDTSLNGKRFSDLTPEQRQRFWNYQLLVEFLPTAETSVVNSVFERVNRNSRKLTRQELRHARYDGWFVQFVEAQASSDEWVQLGIVTKARSRRMVDAQFLSELLAVVIKGDIHGFDQDTLDAMYAEYEEPDDTSNATVTTDDAEQQFNQLRSFIGELIAASADVKRNIKTVTNFYSLWGYLQATDPLPAAVALAPRYLRFMERVNEFVEQPDLPPRADPQHNSFDIAAQKYAQNTIGASTDLPARKARGEALKTALG